MSLIKTVRKVGNGSALPLDNTIMDLVGLHVGDQVQITVDGPRLIVTPVSAGIGKETLEKIMGEIRTKYGKALRELAK
jgi:antitoxin component of MazEF toxin-antitoxin module